MRRLRALARPLVATAAVALVAAGCGEDAAGTAGGAATTTVTVFAAASLADAFTAIEGAFEAAHPGIAVEVNFAASSSLREQILQEAPADVFASADPADVEQLVDAGAAASGEVFATNLLQLAVPAGNPGDVRGLADLAREELLVGLCAEEVPCGRLARRALEQAGVVPALDTNAPDVRALLTQIGSGDLDAGVVYRTDVLSAGATVEGIDIPPEHQVAATYVIAPLTAADDPDAAASFVAYVRSADAQAILGDHGFGAP